MHSATTSASASTSSSASMGRISARGLVVIDRDRPTIFMSKPAARRASCAPMLPKPTMASVLPSIDTSGGSKALLHSWRSERSQMAGMRRAMARIMAIPCSATAGATAPPWLVRTTPDGTPCASRPAAPADSSCTQRTLLPGCFIAWAMSRPGAPRGSDRTRASAWATSGATSARSSQITRSRSWKVFNARCTGSRAIVVLNMTRMVRRLRRIVVRDRRGRRPRRVRRTRGRRGARRVRSATGAAAGACGARRPRTRCGSAGW